MIAIARQIRANLQAHRLQSVLIFLTLLASATLLTIALTTLRCAQGAYDRLFERTQGAHMWLYLNPELVEPEMVEEVLGGIPEVMATTGVMHRIRGTVLAGEERLSGQRLAEWPQEDSMARPLLVEGVVPQPGDADVIVLDRNVALWHGVELGSQVDLLLPNGRHPMTVVGLAVNTETCPYPNCNPPRDYLAAGALSALSLLPPPVEGMEVLAVGMRLQDGTDPRAVLQTAKDALPPDAIDDWDSWESIRGFADAAVRLQRILLITFSIVAGIAAGLLIANAISGAVRSETRQIGLLKAVGFTRGQVAGVYMLEHLTVAAFAGVAGLGVGTALASVILRQVAAKFGETLARPPLWIAVATPVSVLLISGLFTLLPILRAVRLDVVRAIRVGAEQPQRRGGNLPRLPMPLAVGLSEVLSRPVQSVLTALALGLAVVSAITGLIINSTLKMFIDDPATIRDDGDVAIYPSNFLEEAEARRMIEEREEVEGYFTTIWGWWRVEGLEQNRFARFRDGDLSLFRFPIIEGSMFQSADEVVIGYGLVKDWGMRCGDTLSIILEGQEVDLEVVGIYREGSNSGRMLMLHSEALTRFKPDARRYEYVLRLRPGADAKAVAEELRAVSNDLLEVVVVSEETLPDTVTSLPDVMGSLALLLGVISAGGVAYSVWMGVTERQREFGIYKAVGMTPRQVTLSVLIGAALIAVVGYAIGGPLGVLGTRGLINAVARSIGYGPINPQLDWLGIALVLPAAVLVGIAGGLAPARRAGRVSTVEMLRYE